MKFIKMISAPSKSSLPNQLGFTLLEMSIVLAIIGLLAGGVVVGRAMIRQTQINAIMVDARTYITAMNNFRTKYNALPGDMANATSYWGAMATCPPPATSSQTPSTSTLTCNGNGDGIICNGQTQGPCGGPNATEPEPFLVWQHLVNAQMIKGQYTGISGTNANGIGIAGINLPAGSIPGTKFNITHVGTQPAGSNWFAGDYGHPLGFGDAGGLSGYTITLTPAEMGAFDAKYDDGLPGYGSIRTLSPIFTTAAGCTTTTDPTTSVYNTSFTGQASCPLYFLTGF